MNRNQTGYYGDMNIINQGKQNNKTIREISGKMKYTLKKSVREFEKAKKIIPGGAHFSHRPLLKGDFPNYMARGRGSHIWDIDGNEYIDYLLGFGAITLGHSYEKVNKAVIQQLKKGTMLSRPGLVQNELLGKLIQLIPCAEMGYFFKTGSCATSAAVRIARAYTGRYKIVRCGYHGWHDWCCSPPLGVPQATQQLTLGFDFNDVNSLEKVLMANKDEVACVIMEPVKGQEPKAGFLEQVQSLARKHDAVLIFDEVKTFPRVSLKGAQGYYHVIPDMTTLNKGMGNGFAVSAVVGRKEIMQVAEQVRLSATFNVEILSMVAALTTLKELEQKDAIKKIWNSGQMLISGLRRLIQEAGVEAEVTGFAPMFFLEFRNKSKAVRDSMCQAFYRATLERGIFFHPDHVWFVSLSHTKEDISRTLEICRVCLKIAKDAVRTK